MRSVRGYELRASVGTGRYGTTLFRGYQRSVGREVAIRVIGAELANDPDFMSRYQADTSRLAKVNHPHILHVQDTWREPGRVYQVLQWIEGSRLDEYLEITRPTPDDALKMLEQVADALSAAHRSDVTHGAVDERAILISSPGDAYLTDFVVGRPPGTREADFLGFAGVAHVLLSARAPVEAPAGHQPSELACRAGLADVFEQAFDSDVPTPPTALVESLRAAVGTPSRESPDPRTTVRTKARNPYKGLHAFQRDDARDFFGRDELVDRLEVLLNTRRLVAIVGPSGSGKSSLVKAGLAARLATSEQAPLVTEMYPGAYPFDELEGALRQIAVSQCDMSDQLLASELGLTRILKAILPSDNSEVVLVIDQFEELFSMVQAESTRTLFIESIVAAIAEPRSRLRVVVTMRADFFDRPLQYPEFAARFEAGLVPLSTPDRAGLEAAIVGPAAAVGVSVEPGLTDEITRDLGHQPGGLPLLQYAMTELFERRSTDQLTLDAYRASGGVLGALATRAESLFVDMSARGRRAMQQAFMRLVTVDEDARNVRRRVRRAELFAPGIDRRALNDGLALFGSHRLLTFDADPVSRAPTVEVAHEALLGEWDRFRTWIDDQRDHLVNRRRLGAALAEWLAAERDPGYLLTGGRLAELEAWAGSTELALSNEERAYLGASHSQKVAADRRRGARRRRVMAALAVAAVVATSFGIYALGQRSKVADQAYRAETSRIGLEAGFVAEWNRQLALLMAAETYRRDQGFEGLSALQRVLVDAGPFMGIVGAGGDYKDVRWLNDDRVVAVTSEAAHVLDTSSPNLIDLSLDMSEPEEDAVPGAPGIRATSPAGIAALSDASGDVWLLAANSDTLVAFDGARHSTAVAISNDGSLLAAGFADGRVDLFDLDSGTLVSSVVANPLRTLDDLELEPGVLLADRSSDDLGGISHLAFDPAGDRVVSAGGVFIRVWDALDLSPAGPEIVHAAGSDPLNRFVEPPHEVWLDEADSDVVVVVGSRSIVRRRVSTGEREWDGIVEQEGSNGPTSIRAAASAGKGRVLVLTTNGLVTLVDMDGRTADPAPDSGASFAVATQQRRSTSLATDPARTRFAVAFDGGILLGALDGSRLLAEAHPIGMSLRPTLTVDGRILAAGLVTDGVRDVSQVPPQPLPFDVNVEIAEVAGSPATFEFLPSSAEAVLLWTSPFVSMANVYDYESGDFLTGVWGSFVPTFSDDADFVVKVDDFGGTRIESLVNDAVVYELPDTFRAADFDSTASRVLLTFVGRDSPSSGFSPAFGVLVDLETGTETPLPSGPTGIFSAAFTPDDREVVVVAGDGAVSVLDRDATRVVRELQEAAGWADLRAHPPEFTEDGRLMFSASDGRARIWHYETGLQVGKSFPVQAGGQPYAVGDGARMRLVTPFEGRALIWNLDVESWVDLACAAAGRNMTRSEWTQYGPTDTDYRATCPEYRLEGAS